MAQAREERSACRIVVVGEALIDLVVDAAGDVRAVPGGAPANVALAAARLGAPVAFAGAVAPDRFGERLLARLADAGVETDLVQRVDRPTTLAVAELDGRGTATYRFYVDGTSAPALDRVPPVGAHDIVVTGGLALVLEPMATTVERLLRGRSTTDAAAGVVPDGVVMVDVNARPRVIDDLAAYRRRLERVIAASHVVKVSDEDLGVLAPGTEPERAAAGLLDLGPQVVVLTAGSEGTRVLTRTGAVTVPVEPVEVVDTVGAGDTFVGAFVAAWARAGLAVDDLADLGALVDAVAFANRAAGITCTRSGADPPRASEL